ncbi:PilW family protein [Acidovorax soli]|uniref:PilW family protein n=1 Tax=Acidovorax soli TaxID=592050 RepID=UPI0032B1A455
MRQLRQHPAAPAHLRALHGFTLVELMVAMALGLLLLGALVTLVVSTVASRSELDKTSRRIENGRYALQVLSADIESAGFIGATAINSWSRTAPPNACAASITDLGYVSTPTPTLPLAVQMLPSSASGTPPTCLSTANVKSDTGILLITRASSQAITPAAAASNTTEAYVQVSTCGTDTQPFVAALGGNSAFTLRQKDCQATNPAPLRKTIQRIYFISTCNNCGQDSIPTLKVAEYVNGAMTITPLVDGIDNMQFDYGIDMDGNGSPDCYVSNTDNPSPIQTDATTCPQPAAAYDWTVNAVNTAANRANVMAVRISVLARNTEPTGGWTDGGRTYNLGLDKPTVGPFKDGYKRHVYSAVARIVNISGLRETP